MKLYTILPLMKTNDYAIQVKNITKNYKLYTNSYDRLKESLSFSKKKYHQDFLANDNISFNIKRGDVVGIIGANGSGKSTLLKMITGVLTPTSGHIKLNGKVTAMLELTAGFNPELTGMENLYFNGAIAGFTTQEMEERVSTIIEFAEIGQFIYQPIKTYSSGMKARLGFAFSIHIEPEILIIDEALSVGDVAFSRKCYAKIESMCENKKVTVLFVSHSDSVIVKLCSRAILLHKGKLLLDGSPKNVVTHYLKLLKSKTVDIDKLKKEFQQVTSEEANKSTSITITDKSFFSPSLLSKSTVELDRNGAYISDVEIVNSNREKVNILDYMQEYIFRYKVNFLSNQKDVIFTIFIKTEQGYKLGGKEIQYKRRFKKTTSHIIEWKFINILSQGHYLMNCSVITNEYERVVLHRIFDAYLFKVSSTESYDFTGTVDFGLNLISIEEK